MKAENVLAPGDRMRVLASAAENEQAAAVTRMHFIDNVRLFLTVLVILHHIMIIYAGSGSWIYNEGRQDDISSALGAWFTSVNHSYFMGLFFLISAYFVPGSYDRKGPVKFMKDRLLRLGLPLVVYSWLLRPVLFYASTPEYQQLTYLKWYFGRYFRDYGVVGGGPVWFVNALLIFSLFYVLWRLVTPAKMESRDQQTAFPKGSSLLLFVLLLACSSYVTRIWFPADASFKPLNFQLADFPQYILLFIAGLAAYRKKWLEKIPGKTGRTAIAAGIVLICLYPVVAIFAGAIENDVPFKGGLTWQSLVTVIWQSGMCVSLSTSVLYLFGRNFNTHGRLSKSLSRSAYTAYLIHEPIITFLAMGFAGVMLYPLLKFALLALVSIPLIFALSAIIRKLPYARDVL